MNTDRIEQLLERLVLAVEQIGLEMDPRTALPPMMDAPLAPSAVQVWNCPTHGGNRIVPAGVSKKTGKAYEAFMVCGAPGCEQRPPRFAALP